MGAGSSMSYSTPPSDSARVKSRVWVARWRAAVSPPCSKKETIPPGAVRVSEFLADCPFSHRLPDDPIATAQDALGANEDDSQG